MRRKYVDLAKLAVPGIMALAFANAVNASLILTENWDNITIPVADGYLYGDQNGWTNSDGGWFLNTDYAQNSSPGRPDPLSVDVTLHGGTGGGSYTYRALGNTFETGQAVTFSAFVAADSSAVDDSRIFMYLFDGTTTPASFDNDSLAAYRFTADGTSGSTGGNSANDPDSFVAANFGGETAVGNHVGNWQLVSMTYVPGAADAGKSIGVGFYLDRFGTSIDDIVVDVVPEPSSMALLALGGWALLLVRRRRGH